MKNVIREYPGLLTPINGVEFHQLGEISISALVSEEDAEHFCAVPGFRLAEESEVPEALRPLKATTQTAETRAQKAAREKAEKAEADRLVAEKVEADRLAAEKAEADRLAAEETARLAAEEAKQEGGKEPVEKDDEVF